jgi:3-oxoacyl-[acyl-carrier-protein] synthase-3
VIARAYVKDVAWHVPAHRLDNSALEQVFPEFPADKIFEKTGIMVRHIAEPNECASDLAMIAAKNLFERGSCTPGEVDFLILCTQTPDHILPTTACLLQERLGLPRTAGAFDVNLGCSGFVYGLGVAKGLIESAQARNVLLLTADTYSKLIHPQERGVRTLFGDGAAATLVGRSDGDGEEELLGPFLYGTDGRGGRNLIVQAGGFRMPSREHAGDPRATSAPGPEFLFMDGPEIFTFSLKVVPQLVKDLLQRAGATLDQVDLFVFHQANRFMLEHLRNKLKIAEERFVVALEEFGNTVSATIPIALAEARRTGQLRSGQRVMLVGFGVGYSWGGGMMRWRGV